VDSDVSQEWGPLGSQLYNIEDWVKASYQRKEDQVVCILSNMPFNWVRAIAYGYYENCPHKQV